MAPCPVQTVFMSLAEGKIGPVWPKLGDLDGLCEVDFLGIICH